MDGALTNTFMINLVSDTISRGDIDALREWLRGYPKLTMGEKTIEFEQAFSDWLGMEYSVYVNSGSSANLLMLYVLKYKYNITKVAVPAVSWATDVAPLIQLGMTPVLVDCNLEDLSMDLDHLEEVLEDDEIEAVLSVSVLGLVPDMLRLTRICDKHGCCLIEDNCESMGSQRGRVKLGTHGLMSSHSLYFGHHISSIEGGFISTNDKDVYNLLKMLRSHGWARDVDNRAELEEEWGIDEFSALYTFYVPGFNLRSTDLQAFIGLRQLKRIDDIARKRFDNFKLYMDLLKDSRVWTPTYAWFDLVSNFAFPVIYEDKEWTVKRLQENGVEVRPLIAGSMTNQPMYKKEYGNTHLPNANKVDKYGFYVPNHPKLTITDIRKICRLITTYS